MQTVWQGKRVLILGAARQGLALARFLVGQGAQVTLNDQRTETQLAAARARLQDLPIRWVSGAHPLELLDDADLVCPSGGVPLTLPIVTEAVRRGIPLSNDSQIFFDHAPCKIVGITGSAGKTTTTTLVGRMAQADNSARVWVGGNIGNPLLDDLPQMQPDDLAVVELSSFQLELMTRSPQVAAVLNITPNHLDRHGTMSAYTAAKARIVDFQAPQDTTILGADDAGAWGLARRTRGRLLTFGLHAPHTAPAWVSLTEGCITLGRANQTEQVLLPIQDILLRGQHNLLNVMAACAVSVALGLPIEAMRAGVRGFGGVPHRLELVREHNGTRWYNDSIATAPERTMAALRAFDEPLILLAGGRDKNLPWQDFAALTRQRVTHLITFGEAADLIADAVGAPAHTLRSVTRCAGLREAVAQAVLRAEPGMVVLLSPGGTSFDEFADFAERGERFRTWLNELL